MIQSRLAIACQGGGSHTAFTAGVLKRLIDRDIHRTYQITGLSGTSGGGICALLAWYGLLKHAQGELPTPYERLMAFWRDTSARLYWEEIWNTWIVGVLRLKASGAIPEFKVSPYVTSLSWMMDELMEVIPRREFLDFQRLIETYIDFDDVERLVQPLSPCLLLGAVDVCAGTFHTFDSRRGDLSIEAVLASAAIPTLFRAVHLHGHAYWDGLFSQNPPISPFLSNVAKDEKPDEIWIIQIIPTYRHAIPESASDILDRRNELAGNLSLYQEIRFINTVNAWIKDGFTEAFRADHGFKHVTCRRILMSDAMIQKLDYPSRIDRSQAFIDQLIAEGEQQAEHFLMNMDKYIIDTP